MNTRAGDKDRSEWNVFRVMAQLPLSGMQSLILGDQDEELYEECMEDDYYAPLDIRRIKNFDAARGSVLILWYIDPSSNLFKYKYI